LSNRNAKAVAWEESYAVGQRASKKELRNWSRKEQRKEDKVRGIQNGRNKKKGGDEANEK